MTRRRRIPYAPGLDGLRGAAVVAVLLFHGGVSWAQGGFLGVDAFFVLSGFLITSLLVQEWADDGAIALGAFWARRARRLLPALFAVLALVAAYAVWAAPADARHGLRLDGLATLGYVANWRFVLSGATYFGRAELPSPLRHTWSLAIEEQFYLVWPLALAALFRRGWSTARLLAASAAGALVSAALMAVLFHPGGDPSRVYFGTDTHGQPLLIGAALAFALAALAARRRPLPRLDVAAWAGAAALVGSWVLARGDDAWLYRGGFLAVALATAAVVAAVVTAPHGPLSRALSWEPLVVVGRLSYGLYLYHWPIFLWLNGERTGLHGVPLLALRLMATLVVSVLSYRLIELPVRRGGLTNVRLAVVMPAAAVAAAVVLVLSTTAPVATTQLAAEQAPLPHAAPATRVISHPVKVMLIGDSVAKSAGWGLIGQGAKHDAALVDESTLGCGVSRGTPYRDQDRTPAQPPQCATWPDQWKAAVDRQDPDVAVVMMGRWEVMDRMWHGRWARIGEPDYDDYLVSEIETAVGVLGQRQARVVLCTVPYFKRGEQSNGKPWPQDDPARVNRWNDLLRLVAARHPESVALIDLNQRVSPGRAFARSIDGVQVRAADGVHFTPAGGRWLAPWLLPQVVGLAG